MKATIFLTTYDRNDLLEHTLQSIKRQSTDVDIVIINDYLPDRSVGLAKEYGAKYFFTGERNLDTQQWRVPGYALNHAIKRTETDIIIISCAEIYHIDNCLAELLSPFQHNSKCLAIPHGIDDGGKILGQVQRGEHIEFVGTPLNTKLPFLMAMRRQYFMEINGYDEDFTGQGYDDNDLVERLQGIGCHYIQTEARCVHLYHPRNYVTRGLDRLQHNKRLYENRKGILIRNQEKEWGNG